MSDAPFTDAGETDFSELAELFSDAGLDSIWFDLDGDQVPESEIAVADFFEILEDPFVLSDTDPSDPYPSDTDPSDPYPADPATDAPAQTPTRASSNGTESPAAETGVDDGSAATGETWISLPVTDGDGWPVYDVYELLPDVSEPYADWTTDGAYGYDPLQMWNFSVDGGPVVLDPATGDCCCPVDVTDPALWFNDTAFDDGAGYWDPTYAVMPTAPDMSLWQTAPESWSADPAATALWDPYATTSWATPDLSYSWDASALDGGYPSATSTWTTPGYDSTDYTSWSSTSAWDSNPTDITTDYFTDYSFDDQLNAQSAESQFWMDEYDAASDLSWDYWQASVDASTAGDSSLAYDYNQLSLDASSYADTAWSSSSSAWDTSYSSSSSYSADDGWYDAMSLDY